MMVTRMDQPAETVLTSDEIDMLQRRGAARVVIERDPRPGGGTVAIGVVMRRGEPPFNTLLWRLAVTGRKHDDDGRSIERLATLEACSPAKRASFLKKIADRVSERHDDLPPNDDELEIL